MPFVLTSPAFQSGQTIPAKFTCSGANVSPELQWSGAPAKTASFALIMNDPDAPAGLWTHWVIYNIPASQTKLSEAVPNQETLDGGAMQAMAYGVDTFTTRGYSGPCPPPGKPHRYFFKLHALDLILDVPPKVATVFDLTKAMQGHVLGQAELMGLFKR